MTPPATDHLRVHSLETFGTHDGPGIRMVIFVQGCQFRCLYCANPDTIAIEGGELISIDDLVKRAVDEKAYFGKKGGVTVSGGEPLLQRHAIRELFVRLHAEGIHTALDSNGRLIDEAAQALLAETDLLLLDVKHIDDDWHHRLTGLSNRNTLKVAAHREESGKPFWLRYVLVPGWSDQDEFLHQLGQHFAAYQQIEQIEIQPYHQLGMHKWEALGMEYELKGVEPPDTACIERARGIFGQYFRKVKVN
jgi:pyruvate formate lyase activating enzyme